MKILFCRVFGLGNAVMAIPAIKALNSVGHKVDVLIGNTSDDKGAYEVLSHLRDCKIINALYSNIIPMNETYARTVLSIPYDGRWGNLSSVGVMDGRSRPDPLTTGLISWKKHEIEYEMENAYALGYNGEIPDCSFIQEKSALSHYRQSKNFYLGLGYKKDAAGFWKVKHWGNENYAKLIEMILDEHQDNKVITSGDMADLQLTIAPISKLVNSHRFIYEQGNLHHAFSSVNACHMYIGNDTGMMHVAASLDKKVIAIFQLENSITKSRPWCKDNYVFDGVNRQVTPEEVFTKVMEMRNER